MQTTNKPTTRAPLLPLLLQTNYCSLPAFAPVYSSSILACDADEVDPLPPGLMSPMVGPVLSLSHSLLSVHLTGFLVAPPLNRLPFACLVALDVNLDYRCSFPETRATGTLDGDC